MVALLAGAEEKVAVLPAIVIAVDTPATVAVT